MFATFGNVLKQAIQGGVQLLRHILPPSRSAAEVCFVILCSWCWLQAAGRAATRIAGRAACLLCCRPPCPPTSLISVTSLRCHIPHGGEFHPVQEGMRRNPSA